MDAVEGTGSRLKWHTGENSSHTVYLFLNDQAVAIDEGFVPVVAVGPTQHIPKVTVGKGTERAARVHLCIRSAGTQYRAVAIATGILDQSGVA